VALPNKFFDFIQARLCLAISPNTEMKRLIEEYDLGIVSNDFSSEGMAEKIRTLDVQKIKAFKENSHRYSHELSSEKNHLLIRETVNQLIQNRCAA
jgi:hypothetical protein